MMTKKPNSANADDLVSKPNFDCETFIWDIYYMKG
jgi:hypothetical protein